MTNPSMALQEAVVAAVQASLPIISVISGIFEGPPPRAAFPYISLADGTCSDWSTKTEQGREIRFALTVWDDGEQPARLHGLMYDAQEVVSALPRTLDGWTIVSNIFLRSLVVRDPAGPWAGMIEHRVRMMATD